jgi:hypothetical protein
MSYVLCLKPVGPMRQDNPMPELTLSPQSGTMNLQGTCELHEIVYCTDGEHLHLPAAGRDRGGLLPGSGLGGDKLQVSITA